MARGDVRAVLFFGPVWWIIGIAPLLVTYDTPRHLYLAAAGPALATGMLVQRLWGSCARPARVAGVGVAAGLLGACLVLVQQPIRAWNAAGALSGDVSHAVQGQVDRLPTGSLLVLDVDGQEGWQRGGALLWAWALPFALQPPFAPTDLTRRVFVVAPPSTYCCPRDQWFAKARGGLRAWSARPGQPPVVAMLWDRGTGALRVRSEADVPSLRGRVLRMRDARTSKALLADFRRLLDELRSNQQPGADPVASSPWKR
jgi:hypothetical protein